MAELTTTATGDTWHEAVQAAVDEAAELLGDAEVWSVEVEPITTLRIYSEEPRVAWYRATVTTRPKGDVAEACLHVWAEDTRTGDTTRHFICTECGTTRTEERQ